MDQEDLEQSEACWHAHQQQKQRDAAEAARREKASRKQLLDKYHLQAVDTCPNIALPKHAQQAQGSKVSTSLM